MEIRKRIYAFTLIELLISIFIVSVGLVVLFGILVGTISSRDTIERGADREVTALFIIKEMKRELESIYACSKCPFVVEETGFFGKPFDRLIFPTYYGGHKIVEYRFEIPKENKKTVGSPDTAVMIKRVDRNTGISNDIVDFSSLGGYSLKILEGVKEFNVRVFSGGMWQERINLKGSIPQIIDIKMIIDYGKGARQVRLLVEPKHEDIIGGSGVLMMPIPQR